MPRRRNKRPKGATSYQAERAQAAKRGEDLPPEIQHKRRQADPIVNMRSRGLLTDKQFLAAVDIREAFMGVDAAALASLSDPDRYAMAGVSAPVRSRTNLDWRVIDQLRRYKRWRTLSRRRAVRHGSKVRWYDVAFAVVIGGTTPSALDGAFQWRKGTAMRTLRMALDAY